MTYEKRIEKAKELLEKVVDPNATLSESVKNYKKGLGELSQAQKLIEEAKAQIEVIEKEYSDG
ncbi:MAG: exodeoxyribonuclease VII small subunit [Campylobacterota bacterium]